MSVLLVVLAYLAAAVVCGAAIARERGGFEDVEDYVFGGAFALLWPLILALLLVVLIFSLVGRLSGLVERRAR